MNREEMQQAIDELVEEGFLERVVKDDSPAYRITQKGKVEVENTIISKLGINPSDFNKMMKKAKGKITFEE